MKKGLVRALSFFMALVMIFGVTPVYSVFADDDGSGTAVEEQKNGWDETNTFYYVDDVAVTGFYVINGKTYYFSPDTAEKATGLKKIDGEYYLFTDGGAMRYGWKNYGEARYYFDTKSGKGAKGLKKIDGAYYLFGDNARMRKGFQTYNGEKYRFSPKNGKAVKGLKKVGKYLILLCKGTACHVNGADSIEKAICEELKISDGDTTEDGLFSLKTVACLGCCSLSPVMMINEETYGSLTPSKTTEILREIKAREAK